MSEVQLFVYGTLRPGWGNYERFPGLASHAEEDVTANGILYWAYGVGSYPYAVLFPGCKDKVVGTLLTVDTASLEFRMVFDMERRAGYTYEEIELSDGRIVMAFNWHESVRKANRIRSGDWAKEAYGAIY